MKSWGIIFALALGSFKGWSQYNPDKVNKKARTLYDKAIESAQTTNFTEGIRILRDAVKADPKFEEAYLSIAGMYGEMKEYDSAIINYEKAKAIDSLYFKDYNLPYSINIAGKGDFQKALKALDDFLTIPNLNEKSLKAADYRKKSYQFAIDYSKEKPLGDYKFEPKNLGDSINTNVSEYYPAITIDGKELFFTRRVKNINEDFFEARLSPGGNNWAQAKKSAREYQYANE